MGKPNKKTLAKKTLAEGHVLPWDNALTFLLAGHCVVTLDEVVSADRSTYHIEQAVDDVRGADGKITKVKRQRWFVSLLTGSDNERSYRYLGTIDAKFGAQGFRTTKPVQASADSINRIGDVVRWLVAGCDNSHKIRVWHRGLCGQCGATLSVPSSIATGLGPICAANQGVAMKDVTPDAITKLGALAPAIEPEHVNEG